MRQKASDEEQALYGEALGRSIRVLRTELGLNRKELAERCGLSYPYLSEIEAGKKHPSSKALRAIADSLGVSPHEFMAAAEDLVLGWGHLPHQMQPAGRRFHDDPPVAAIASEPEMASRMGAFPDSRPSRPIPQRELAELMARARKLRPEDLERVLDLARRLSP